MTTLPAGSSPIEGGALFALGSTDMTGVALTSEPSADSTAIGFSSVLGVCTEMPPAPTGINVLPVPRVPLPVVVDAAVVPSQPPLSTSPRALQMKATPLPEADVVVTAEDDAETKDLDASLFAETTPDTVVPVEIWGQSISAPVVVPLPDTKTVPVSATGRRCPSPLSTDVGAPSDHAVAAPATLMRSTASEVPAPAAIAVERVAKPVATAPAPLNPVEISKPDLRTEKIAVAAVEPVKPALTPSEITPDNKFLPADKQIDVKQEKPLGIVNAKSRDVMRTKPDFTSSLPVAEAAAGTARDVAVITPLQAGEGIAISSARTTPVEQPVLKISSHAVDAAGVVREVVELTHEFRARERSSVEVKFNFKDDSELSVRLAYRDGDVHTTFRTDSDSLRAALSREWQGYVAGATPQPRDYRVAEPVFTRAQDFTGSFEDRNSGSSAGGDARQQHASHSDDQAAPRTGSSAAVLRGSSLSPAAVLPAAGPRSSSDRLLHAFA